MKKNILWLFLCLGTPLMIKAQLCDNNIIPNGGFEEFTTMGRPVGWYIPTVLFSEKVEDVCPGSTGQYALKVYANGGSMSLIKNGQGNVLEVQQGKSYILSFWHKGSNAGDKIQVSFSWYQDLTRKGKKSYDEVATVTDWKREEIVVEVPGGGINKAGLGFRIYRGQGDIIFDDVCMVEAENQGGSLPIPKSFEGKAYQREIELTWDKAADPDVEWEVFVDAECVAKVNTNFYTLENLELGNDYKVKIRSVKDREYSDYTEEINFKTRSLEKAVDSDERIPYLRTIGNNGVCTKEIKLYYLDLAEKEAKISYKIDGVPVFPENGMLKFPKEGRSVLEIKIEETPERIWNITYRLAVREK